MELNIGDTVTYKLDGEIRTGKITQLFNHEVWIDNPFNENYFEVVNYESIIITNGKKGKGHLPDWL